MNLFVRKSPAFQIDVTQQFEWYFDKAGEQLAWRFFTIIDLTLSKLSGQPDPGAASPFPKPIASRPPIVPTRTAFPAMVGFLPAQTRGIGCRTSAAWRA
jgi:hypothetical protein